MTKRIATGKHMAKPNQVCSRHRALTRHRAQSRHQAQSGHRNAWTVIELMTVLMISSMLVATLLTVTVSIQQAAARSRKTIPYDGSAFAFQRQLQSEFAASRDIYPGRRRLVLDGYFLSSEQGTGHGPSRIAYETRTIEGTPWLIRRETSLQEPAGQAERVRIVCKNFSHFEYSRTDISDSPPQFYIKVYKLDPKSQDPQPWFETVLVRHGGAS